MNETGRDELIKKLKELRGKAKEPMSYFKKLRREMKSSIKRLERKRKLPEEVGSEIDRVDQTILYSFLKAYRFLLNRAIKIVDEDIEELEIKEERRS